MAKKKLPKIKNSDPIENRNRISKESIESAIVENRERTESNAMKKMNLINVLIVGLTVLLGGIPAAIPVLVRILKGDD